MILEIEGNVYIGIDQNLIIIEVNVIDVIFICTFIHLGVMIAKNLIAVINVISTDYN